MCITGLKQQQPNWLQKALQTWPICLFPDLRWLTCCAEAAAIWSRGAAASHCAGCVRRAPSLGLCFYILGDFFIVDGTGRRSHGPGFGSREEETSVKVMKRAMFFLSQQLGYFLWPARQPRSESQREQCLWQPPLLRSTGERCSAVPSGLAPTAALLSSEASQLSFLLLAFKFLLKLRR